MRSCTTWLLPALLVVGLTNVGPALAQPRRDPSPRVQDNGGLFSEAAVQKANAGIADIKRRLKKDLLIETFAEASAGVKDVNLNDKKAKRRFFQQWAIREAEAHRVNGIYLLICAKPHYVQVVVGEKTRDLGLFTDADEDELANEVIAGLKSKDKDEALRKAVAFVSRILERHEAATTPANSSRTGGSHSQPAGKEQEPEGTNWVLYICLGVVALLVIWVIFGVIRAMTRSGPGYGGGGYGGGGYGGGGYGGGGGGFFSSLIGGMFGAAAGMWMYNNFFGGGSHGYQGSDNMGTGAGTGGAADVGGANQSDVGGEYHAGGGGDWDAGAGGGGGKEDAGVGGEEDVGGGGGDWGGGGDAGGGGDFGGGGGDVGGGDVGGGGGDW